MILTFFYLQDSLISTTEIYCLAVCVLLLEWYSPNENSPTIAHSVLLPTPSWSLWISVEPLLWVLTWGCRWDRFHTDHLEPNDPVWSVNVSHTRYIFLDRADWYAWQIGQTWRKHCSMSSCKSLHRFWVCRCSDVSDRIVGIPWNRSEPISHSFVGVSFWAHTRVPARSSLFESSYHNMYRS